MSALTKAEFENALRAAVSRRETRYSNFYAFHFRWEDDDTNADRDGKSFAEMAKLLAFPQPEEYVIPKQEAIPGFKVNARLMEIISKAGKAPGRSVVMVHYSGHGGPNLLNELELSSKSGKRIAASLFISHFTNEIEMPLDTPIDVVFIFDCCYSFLATRNATEDSRIVEMIAVAGPNDPVAFAAGPRNSLTQKLFVEVRARAQNGDKRLEMADVVATLRQSSPVKKPTYTAALGTGSICLPIQRNIQALSTPGQSPTRSVPGLLATFSIHVAKTFGRQELRDLVHWLDQLPRSNGESLRLENVKVTRSMLFIMEGSLVCFLRICELPGVKLICENEPEDFSWLLQRTWSSSMASLSLGGGLGQSSSGGQWPGSSGRLGRPALAACDQNLPPSSAYRRGSPEKDVSD